MEGATMISAGALTVLGNPVEIRNFATAIRGVESGGQIEAAGVR